MEAVLRTLLGATHPSFKNPFTSASPMAGAFDYSFELQAFGLFFFLLIPSLINQTFLEFSILYFFDVLQPKTIRNTPIVKQSRAQGPGAMWVTQLMGI